MADAVGRGPSGGPGPDLLQDSEGVLHRDGCAMATGTLALVLTVPADSPGCPWCD